MDHLFTRGSWRREAKAVRRQRHTLGREVMADLQRDCETKLAALQFAFANGDLDAAERLIDETRIAVGARDMAWDRFALA